MIHSRLIVGALLILSMLLFAGIAACGEAATSEPDTDSAAATTEDSSTSEEATTESETSTESESTTEDQAGTEDESEADTSTTSTTGTTPSTSTDSTTSSTTQETTEGEEDSAMVMREVSDALKQYAADNAGRAGAIYVGDINQLVGPAPMDQEGNPDADLADLQGNVPLDALEDHTWLYNSDYYWSLLERAKLTEPTPLTSSGESIELQHVCINRSLLPCKIIEQFWAPNLEDRTDGQLTITVSSFPELGPERSRHAAAGLRRHHRNGQHLHRLRCRRAARHRSAVPLGYLPRLGNHVPVADRYAPAAGTNGRRRKPAAASSSTTTGTPAMTSSSSARKPCAPWRTSRD